MAAPVAPMAMTAVLIPPPQGVYRGTWAGLEVAFDVPTGRGHRRFVARVAMAPARDGARVTVCVNQDGITVLPGVQ